MPTFSFLSSFLLAGDQSGRSFPHPVWWFRRPAVLIGSFKGCCWTMPTLVFLSQMLQLPFFEFRYRKLRAIGENFGTWHISPAAISSMDQQIRNLQNPGSFGTGSRSRWGWEKSLWLGIIWPMQIPVHSASEISPQKHWLVIRGKL